MSRYSHPCPACGVIISPHEGKRISGSVLCPACGAELTRGMKSLYVTAPLCLLGGIRLALHLGYQGLLLVLVAELLTFLLLPFGLAVGAFVEAVVFAPGFKLVRHSKGRPFDRVTSLHLTDRT